MAEAGDALNQRTQNTESFSHVQSDRSVPRDDPREQGQRLEPGAAPKPNDLIHPERCYFCYCTWTLSITHVRSQPTVRQCPNQAAWKQHALELASHGVCCNYVIRRPPISEASPERQPLQTKTEVLLLGTEEGGKPGHY